MSTSIYNINDWSNNTVYKKNDIVYANSLYYYAKSDHTSHPSQTFSQTIAANPTLWGGVGIDPYSGATKPQFFWTPSYSSNINSTPKVKSIKFGDGYEQRIRDGINSILLEIDIGFENRDIDEATAITHFFHEKESTKSFLFVPSPPYNLIKKFVCRSWNNRNEFYNNHTITAKFEEVSA